MERSDVVMLEYNTASRLANRETKKEEIPPQILALMRDPVEENLNDILWINVRPSYYFSPGETYKWNKIIVNFDRLYLDFSTKFWSSWMQVLLDRDLMARIWKKAISILAGNLNPSYYSCT